MIPRIVAGALLVGGLAAAAGGDQAALAHWRFDEDGGD
jgi:hypothetical protein